MLGLSILLSFILTVSAVTLTLDPSSPTIKWSPEVLSINGTGWNPRFQGTTWPYKSGEWGAMSQMMTNTSGSSCTFNFDGTGITVFGTSKYPNINPIIKIDNITQINTIQWSSNYWTVNIQSLNYSTHSFSLIYDNPSPGLNSAWDDFVILSFTLTVLPYPGYPDSYVPGQVRYRYAPNTTATTQISQFWDPQGAWETSHDPLPADSPNAISPDRAECQWSHSQLTISLSSQVGYIILYGIVGIDHGPYSIKLSSKDGSETRQTNYNGFMPWYSLDKVIYSAAVDFQKNWTVTIQPLGNQTQYVRIQSVLFYMGHWNDQDSTIFSNSLAISAPNAWTTNSAYPSSSTSPPPKSGEISIPAIVGAAVGGAVFIAVIIALLLIRTRRRRREAEETEKSRAVPKRFEIEPYEEVSTGAHQSTSSLDYVRTQTQVDNSQIISNRIGETSALLMYSELRAAEYPPTQHRPSNSKGVVVQINDTNGMSSAPASRRMKQRTSIPRDEPVIRQEVDGRRLTLEEERVLIPPTYDPAWQNQGEIEGSHR